MNTIDPIDLAAWAEGEWKNGKPVQVTGLANDSRKATPGQLFAALKTSSRDGHDFVVSAEAAGASGAIVERLIEGVSIPQLVVEDVGKALLRMAKGYRSSWSAKVVGVTGSCGKTTCKEVLACLLSEQGVLSTPGNLNNLIGVPISVLRTAGAASRFAVLEAGISEPGEMAQMAEVIDPEWGIITAIGASHLEDLATIENVAIEKGKLLQQPRLRQVFVGSSAEPFLELLGCRDATVVSPDTGLEKDWTYAVRFSEGRSLLSLKTEESVEIFEYEGMGDGLASNVALALATALSMGLSAAELRQALASYQPSSMRNEWREFGGRRAFIDCYNANPLSMKDSLATFVAGTAEEEARFYLVGCMEELGQESERLHEELGRIFPFRKQDFLLVIGSEASSVLRGMKLAGNHSENCFEIGSVEEAKPHLDAFAGSVFLKGSRRYGLESALAFLSGGAKC